MFLQLLTLNADILNGTGEGEASGRLFYMKTFKFLHIIYIIRYRCAFMDGMLCPCMYLSEVSPKGLLLNFISFYHREYEPAALVVLGESLRLFHLHAKYLPQQVLPSYWVTKYQDIILLFNSI